MFVFMYSVYTFFYFPQFPLYNFKSFVQDHAHTNSAVLCSAVQHSGSEHDGKICGQLKVFDSRPTLAEKHKKNLTITGLSSAELQKEEKCFCTPVRSALLKIPLCYKEEHCGQNEQSKQSRLHIYSKYKSRNSPTAFQFIAESIQGEGGGQMMP